MIYTISEGSIQSQSIPQDIIVSGHYIVKLSRDARRKGREKRQFLSADPVTGKRNIFPVQ